MIKPNKKAVISVAGLGTRMLPAPITNIVRGMALEIPLRRTATNGVVLMYQLRSLDVASRNVSFVEKVPKSVIKKATEIAITVIR